MAVTHRPLRPSRNKETSAEAIKQQTQKETKMMKEGHDKLELLNTICLPNSLTAQVNRNRQRFISILWTGMWS